MAIKKGMWPGIILTFVLALAAKLLVQFIPQLGAEALAMLIGIVLGNTVFNDSKWSLGIKWAEKFPIEIGIALLGLTVTLATIEMLGWSGVIFILLQMTLTIVFVMWLGGRIFKVSPEAAMLMGAGNAVCGSSAIASVAPAIGATDDQRRTSVATVSIMGVILLLVLPFLGPNLLHHDNLLVGALIGGTVQSVGQVVGTAALVNPTVVTYATLFKMLRVILLSVVVVALSNHAHKLQNATATTTQTGFKFKAPWFVTTFVIFMLLGSVMTLPTLLTGTAKSISGFFGIVNLAGIGLNLKWTTIKAAGGKFFGYGLVIIIFQVALALLLIYTLMH
ncbi:putative sulfate exporter family transporter [Weissella soli]|uniref:YeiH family protein n=1 Tax=Weissella soli TaxID=155866 RepID=UPI0021C1AE06|nr:putative sulfate exporter family transporter [Weissella soli]MCT8395740.1 putative sulfate exporter family transporter [Weissella soli]